MATLTSAFGTGVLAESTTRMCKVTVSPGMTTFREDSASTWSSTEAGATAIFGVAYAHGREGIGFINALGQYHAHVDIREMLFGDRNLDHPAVRR